MHWYVFKLLTTKRLTTQIPGIWVYPSYVHADVLPDYLNYKWQSTHTTVIWMLPNVYMLMCLQNPHTTEWLLIHIILIWMLPSKGVVRLPLLLNNLLHTTQENGSSPLCTNFCSQIPPLLNNWIHTSHLNGFSPLSMFQCLYTTHLWLNDFLRTSQWNERSPAQWCGYSTLCIDTHFMNKSLITHITGKSMLPAMYHFMILQSTLIIEWHIACITFIYTVPHMY